MLKVNDHGVTITLNGKTQGDGMFWLALFLLMGAVGVVFALSFFSAQLAIGALFLLIVGSFLFNNLRLKQKQQSGQAISSGVIDVNAGVINHNTGIKKEKILVLTTDRLQNHGTSLTVFDANDQKKCHLSGFESAKEVEVMQKVLQGQSLNKRNANITMKSN